MCIRDRDRLALALGLLRELVLEPVTARVSGSQRKSYAAREGGDDQGPVSYTHLDVYQRQAIPFAALALLLGLTACGSPASGSVQVGPDATVPDVPTAAEHAAGQLEGAQQLDFNAGDVAAAIPSLDPDAEYLVYCRSGNRSGQAIALMEQAGFTDLTNLGSLEQAADATGLPIVK